MQKVEKYHSRPIRFLEIWQIDNWDLKVYSITYGVSSLDENLIKEARRVIEKRLAESAEQTNHFNMGFVGIHQGKTGNFVFVDWWADENELHHHVYVSSPTQPDKLKYITPTGLSACAWDLFLIGHERDAWVKHILMKAETPDFEGYLAARMNKDV